MSRHGARTSPSIQLLKVEGIPAPVEIRRHPTARRLTLRVSRTQRAVTLTMPRNYDVRDADRFLAKSVDWVLERLEGVPEAAPFKAGVIIPLRGEPHEIVFVGSAPGRAVVEVIAATGRQTGLLKVAGMAEHAPRRLRDWLIGEAARELDLRVGHHAANLGLRARRISLRDQKSRWGSCSTTGQLSFSWRLIMAPPFVLDYVAAHEVAHLAEMNHGPRFWRLVAKTMPSHEEAKLWLRSNGMDLYRYGEEG